MKIFNINNELINKFIILLSVSLVIIVIFQNILAQVTSSSEPAIFMAPIFLLLIVYFAYLLKIKLKDIAFLFSVGFLIVGLILFCSKVIGIFYFSVDAAEHFDMAKTFSLNHVPLYVKQSSNTAYYGYPSLFYIVAGYAMTIASTIIGKLWVFNGINILIYLLNCIVIWLICSYISKKIVHKIIIFLFLVLGFPLDLLFNGFLSQLTGVLFLCLIFLLRISEINQQFYISNKLKIILYITLAMGIYYSYYLYMPIAIGLIIIALWGSKKNIIYVAILFLLLGFPVARFYLADAHTINADGGISKDIYSSFIPFFFGLSIFYYHKSNTGKFLLYNLVLVFFALVTMYFFVALKIASPYYFFKFYIVAHLALGFSALYVLDQYGFRRIRMWILSTLAISIFAGYSFFHNDFYSQVLGCQNNPIYRYNIFNFEKGYRLSKNIVFKISSIKKPEANINGVCVVGDDPRTMIWFHVLSDGIYYRGLQSEKYPWTTGEAWKDISFDQKCELKYDKVIILNE